MAKAGDKETKPQGNKGAAPPAAPDATGELARILKLKPAQLALLGRKAAMGGPIAGLSIKDALTLTRALLYKFGQSLGIDDLLEPTRDDWAGRY